MSDDQSIITAHPARRANDGSGNLECGCGWIVNYKHINFGYWADVAAQEDAQHAAHVAAVVRQARA